MGSRRSSSLDKKVSWGNPPPGSSRSGYVYPPTVSGSSSSFGGKREDEDYLPSSGFGSSEGFENGHGGGVKRQRRESEMFGFDEGIDNR